MATNHNKSVTEAPKDTEAPKAVETPKAKEKPAEPAKNAQESVYSAAELARAHKTFNTSYEIVATALKIAKVDKASVAQAKEIIERFKNKEVN